MGPGRNIGTQSHIHEIALRGAASRGVKTKAAQRCPARRSAGQRL